MPFAPAPCFCKITSMPPSPDKSATPAVLDKALPSSNAFEFIHEGLDYTVRRMHGSESSDSKVCRHVSGQDLCEGLRDLALTKWGRLARTVLLRWDITCTLDFGRIVYSMIDMGLMQKQDDDSLDDFKNVYDFAAALESDYRIPSNS